MGSVGGVDLTVRDADRVQRFYEDVAQWRVSPLEMGGYSDYLMLPPGGRKPVAGVCHKRGVNAKLPPVWMIYIKVPDLDASLKRCQELGGKVLVKPAAMGAGSRYAVIEDPAGAVCALYQVADEASSPAL